MTIAIRRAPSARSPSSSAPAEETTGTSASSARSTSRIWSSAVQWKPGPCAISATRQAVATTSQRASASSAAARPVCSFIERSSSGVTWRMRMRLEWNVKRSSGASGSRARSSAGISVSIVTLELGTISPRR